MKNSSMSMALIAPCGMNCRLCRAYARDKNPCPGCRGDDSKKSKTRIECRIKTCEQIAKGRVKYCFDCKSFPCTALKHIDKRYSTKYGMSMIENLGDIKQLGIKHFIKYEMERWTCPSFREIICVHWPQCLACEHKWR